MFYPWLAARPPVPQQVASEDGGVLPHTAHAVRPQPDEARILVDPGKFECASGGESAEPVSNRLRAALRSYWGRQVVAAAGGMRSGGGGSGPACFALHATLAAPGIDGRALQHFGHRRIAALRPRSATTGG